MEQLSTTARDQSIWSERASQSSSAKCIRSQTPARCQSRRRRQHVIPSRTRVPAGASARECRCEGRRRCPSGTRDPKRVVCHLEAVVEESARRVRQDPTTDLEATPWSYAVHATSPTRIRFGRFCYAYLD